MSSPESEINDWSFLLQNPVGLNNIAAKRLEVLSYSDCPETKHWRVWHLLHYPFIKAPAHGHTLHKQCPVLVHPKHQLHSLQYNMWAFRVKVEHQSAATFHVLISAMIFLSLQLVRRWQVSGGETLSCSHQTPSDRLMRALEGVGGHLSSFFFSTHPPFLSSNATQDLQHAWAEGWS